MILQEDLGREVEKSSMYSSLELEERRRHYYREISTWLGRAYSLDCTLGSNQLHGEQKMLLVVEEEERSSMLALA